MVKKTRTQRPSAWVAKRDSRVRIVGDTAIVELTRGYNAVIDAADAPLVAQFSWRTKVVRRRDGSERVYARTDTPGVDGKRSHPNLHRVILRLTPAHPVEVDHADGNGLNNRRSNLRVATHVQNSTNRGANSNNRLGVKGVSPWHGKYQAKIQVNRRQLHLGVFPTIQEACAAYNAAALKYHGAFARLSTVPPSKPPSGSTPDQCGAVA